MKVAAEQAEIELPALQQALHFAERLRDAADGLFAGTTVGERLIDVARRLENDCRRLAERGGCDCPAIVLVGQLGKGKSWLARCFLSDHPDNEAVRSRIRSGQDSGSRTKQLLWLGHDEPVGLEVGAESFHQIPAERMLDLGRPYVVGDSPAFSNADEAAAGRSDIAMYSAAVKILVHSIEQLRDGGTEQFLKRMQGSVVLPVFRFTPEPPDEAEPPSELVDDVLEQIARWKTDCPVKLLDPCFMPDKDVFGDHRATELMRSRLSGALVGPLSDAENLKTSVDDQIRHRLGVARREAAASIPEFMQRAKGPVDRINDAEQRLPERLVSQLLGNDAHLARTIRMRLRGDWLDNTPVWCFPYRSLAGVLWLTAGAWDRLIIAFAGSVPSLGMSIFAAAKNIRQAQRLARQIREGVRDKIQRLVSDSVRDDLRDLQNAVRTVAGDSSGLHTNDVDVLEVRVSGIEVVEADSHYLFQTSLSQRGANPATPRCFALVATVAFWLVLAGPMVTIYRQYFRAWVNSLGGDNALWSDFPTPSPSMLLAAFILSATPAFILALIGLGWCCRRKLVEQVSHQIKVEHDEMLRNRHASGELHIEITSPKLEAARFLAEMAQPVTVPMAFDTLHRPQEESKDLLRFAQKGTRDGFMTRTRPK